MPDPVPYDAAYHGALHDGARRSAECVLPLVLDLLRPASLVDVGCGSGAWVAAALAAGVEDALGLDGPWVEPGTLVIPKERFRAMDLARPVDLGRRFELALCLEVAEHLPPEAAPVLVETLSRHAPAVLFSAAVPGQGGEGHVNEAWPKAWIALFAEAGFDVRDALRRRLWDDEAVEPWYRQNLLLFCERGWLEADPARAARLEAPAPSALVHPAIWRWRCEAIHALEAELAAARDALAGERAEVVRLGGAWQTLADENAALRGDLAGLRASRSWQLTAPLRRLDAAARRVRGGHTP